MKQKFIECYRKICFKYKKFKFHLSERTTILCCKTWKKLYVIRRVVKQFWNRYYNSLLLVIGVGSFITSFYFSDEMQQLIFDYFKLDNPKDTDISFIKTTLSNIGICLIGVSIIAFTLAMFSIQQSSEKLPHKFFQQIQKDWKVIFLFLALFIIALFLSILPSCAYLNNIVFFLLTQFWLMVIYLTLIAYTYKCAMQLISPFANLDALVNSLEQKFKFWHTYYKRIVPKEAYPIIDSQPNNELKRPQVYIQKMPEIKEGLGHLFYIAQRYARAGDIDISNYALNDTLIKMNKLYIQVKAGAFYADTIFAKNPLSNDEYLNETIEKLKQMFDGALARNEDDFAIQSLQAFNQLVSCYADIEYKNDLSNSTPYAYIACDILCRSVSLASSQKRIGVVLNGVRIIGVATQTLLAKSSLENIEKGIGTIKELSITALTMKESLPVVLVGVGQLSLLSKVLIESDHFNIQEASKFIKEAFRTLVIGILMQTEKFIPQTLLAPFFSYAESSSLINYFLNILETDLLKKDNQAKIEQYIQNFYFWFVSDGENSINNFEHEKALLRLAVRLSSPSTTYLISWIVILYKVAIHLSQLKLIKSSDANPWASSIEIVQQNLRFKTRGLLLIFSEIAITQETVYFLEQCHLTMYMVEMLLFALQKDASVIYDAVDTLTHWGVSSLSKRTLIKALCSLIALNIEYGNEETTEQIKNKFLEYLAQNKNNWDVNELQKAKEILETNSFEEVDNFIDTNMRNYLLSIINKNAGKATALSKEFAKIIGHRVKEKDLE